MGNLLVAQVGNELQAANCHAFVIALEGLQKLQRTLVLASELWSVITCSIAVTTQAEMHSHVGSIYRNNHLFFLNLSPKWLRHQGKFGPNSKASQASLW